jgi:malonyl-CoA decarboxylase
MASLTFDRAFLTNLLGTLTDRGRDLIRGLTHGTPHRIADGELAELGETLLSRRGEATGVALAQALLAGYETATPEQRLAFLEALADLFGPEREAIERAIEKVRAEDMSPAAVSDLHDAAEPRRQELIRRLNLAPGGTAALVRMREELLTYLAEHPQLRAVDNDFVHLFASWFNRGFLVLHRIDWTTPANILEKIIRYEAVHAIRNWDDLRNRLAPPDRRCYGFFHPRLVDEPLIFVEVALTKEIPGAIAPLLEDERTPINPKQATTAVFYSISNTQRGLGGISFGNFLIKQVVEDLKRELPGLNTFVTLSPVPGFASWLARERASDNSAALDAADKEVLTAIDQPGWINDPAIAERVKPVMLAAAAYYFLEAKDKRGRAADPVARFHLGNGARLEKLDYLGDTSAKGLKQSHGLMVNYCYDLDDIEANHEAFVEKGVIAASSVVRKRLQAKSGFNTGLSGAA